MKIKHHMCKNVTTVVEYTLGMADDMSQCLDALNFANSIIGATESIKIDSGVYKHMIYLDIEERLDESKDIIKIRASRKRPINMTGIIKAFNKIQKQRTKTKDLGRSYYFEGIRTVPNSSGMYEILWGS